MPRMVASTSGRHPVSLSSRGLTAKDGDPPWSPLSYHPAQLVSTSDVAQRVADCIAKPEIMVGTDSGIAFAAIEPMEIMNKVNQAILRSREFIDFPVGIFEIGRRKDSDDSIQFVTDYFPGRGTRRWRPTARSGGNCRPRFRGTNFPCTAHRRHSRSRAIGGRLPGSAQGARGPSQLHRSREALRAVHRL